MTRRSVKIARIARNLVLGAAIATGFSGGAQAASLDIYVAPGGYHGGHQGDWRGGHGGRHYGDRICRPGEAVQKAFRQGMRRPGIERVTRREVVVTGRFRGHRAMLVFDRNSSRCRVLYSRGI